MKIKNLVLISAMVTIGVISGCGSNDSKATSENVSTENVTTEKNIDNNTETNNDSNEKSNTSEAEKTEKKTSKVNKDVFLYSDGCVFRNSNWGDRIDTVMESEPFELHEENRPGAGKYQKHYVSDEVQIGNRKAILYYSFDYGKLYQAAIAFVMSDGDEVQKGFEELKALIIEAFGEPTEIAEPDEHYVTGRVFWEKDGVKYSINGRDSRTQTMVVFDASEIK